MKKHVCIIFISILLTSCCANNSSCISVRAWDGAYSRENIHKKMEKKREEYYKNESIEDKKRRVENQKYCDELSVKKFNEFNRETPSKIISMSDLYTDCMRDRGTPVF